MCTICLKAQARRSSKGHVKTETETDRDREREKEKENIYIKNNKKLEPKNLSFSRFSSFWKLHILNQLTQFP